MMAKQANPKDNIKIAFRVFGSRKIVHNEELNAILGARTRRSSLIKANSSLDGTGNWCDLSSASGSSSAADMAKLSVSSCSVPLAGTGAGVGGLRITGWGSYWMLYPVISPSNGVAMGGNSLG